MDRRKGDLTIARLQRDWPHHVALPAEAMRLIRNSKIVQGIADTLSVAPRTYRLHRDNRDFVVLCFAKPKDARAFAGAVRRRAAWRW